MNAESKNHLYLFAIITPKKEYYEKARKSLQSIIIPTLEEKGCQVFSQFDSKDNNGCLYLFERFSSEEDLQEHYEKDYAKRILDLYSDWLEKPVEVIKMFSGSEESEKQFI